MAQVWSVCACACIVLMHLIQLSVGVHTDHLDVRLTLPDEPGGVEPKTDKCLDQLHSSLERLRKRQETSRVASLIDLSGYALHQSLRNAPVDMYVTDIKVRAPSVGSWVQVQGCQFSRNAEMKTHLLFNDLLISGLVRLLPGDLPFSEQSLPPPSEQCTMTLRLRRAGLDVTAAPDLTGSAKIVGGGLQLRTESSFVHPHFLSVHAYGCRLDQWAKEGWFDYPVSQRASRKKERRENDDGDGDGGEIRIISLGEEPELQDQDEDLKDFYRQRILSYSSPSEKLAAVLGVKKQIAQQTNAIFQIHGPFSQYNKPAFTPHVEYSTKPAIVPSPVSTITELDEKLRPVRPVATKPFQALISSTTPQPKLPLYGPQTHFHLQGVSTEMEDVFLRGAKALLAKYLEKQLETPLKEAIMTKIGYTVSYG